jgi:hypothetical protein
VFAVSKEMGLNIPFPMSYDEFLSHKYHGVGVKSVHVDNADLLLQYISDVPVHTTTISTDLPCFEPPIKTETITPEGHIAQTEQAKG